LTFSEYIPLTAFPYDVTLGLHVMHTVHVHSTLGGHMNKKQPAVGLLTGGTLSINPMKPKGNHMYHLHSLINFPFVTNLEHKAPFGVS
jgi:hypothetical protein